MNLEESRGGTLCLSKAGLAIGSTPAQLAIAAPNGAGVDFVINGTLYHKADIASVAVTAQAIQPALYTCLYLVQLNAAGTLSTVKGTQVLTAALAAKSAVLKWPEPTSALYCPIGAYKVVTALTATYTAATTDHDAANVTTTYIDLMCIPPSPLTA
jgi:hypothetical protein